MSIAPAQTTRTARLVQTRWIRVKMDSILPRDAVVATLQIRVYVWNVVCVMRTNILKDVVDRILEFV